MNIGIIGTRGIPNHYGGFEQLAEKLSLGLLQNGHRVTVYNSHSHPYREKTFNGVELVHCYDAESWLGTLGQFIYDLNCIRDARKKRFDVLLFLGYTSSSIWGRWYPKKTLIISNMDGLEWARKKYSKAVRRFLQYAEKLAVKHSDHFIADSVIIQSYLKKKYGISSEYIAYGAPVDAGVDKALLKKYDLIEKKYLMLMARMEPENNIEMILDGFHRSNSAMKFIVLGNCNNSYGKYIVKKFSGDNRIQFAGSVFHKNTTLSMMAFCHLYFHGHSVGGTNPSLLEAMAGGALIAAHDNPFNKVVLSGDGYYFSTAKDVKELIETEQPGELVNKMSANNSVKIKNQYNWPFIVQQYEEFISACYKQSGK